MDILFFAAIAIFIIFKLKSQLGQISDEEKERIVKKRQEQLAQLQTQIIKQIENAVDSKIEETQESIDLTKHLNENVKKTLEEIFQSCKISTKFFLDGAKSAFEMVIKAFASHDTETLKFLLSDKIFENFEKTISDRKQQEKTLNSEIISIEKAEILSASIEGNKAFISVRFTSKQINYFTNKNGEVTEGTKEQINELQDVWTFKKDLTLSDPNWKISATG